MTTKPLQTTPDKEMTVDEILDELFHNSGVKFTKIGWKLGEEQRQEAKVQLQKLIEGVIGEDELDMLQQPPMMYAKVVSPHELHDVNEVNQRITQDTANYQDAMSRHRLRAEQRKRLTKIMEG